MKKANALMVWVVASALTCAAPVCARGVQDTPAAQAADGTGTHTWPVEQLVPLSVREAWAMCGKTEPAFFDMVKELAELSAQKRGITLPDNKEAGMKAGEWIKRQAKKDPDQLLYVVVDRAVQYSARVGTASTSK